MGQWVRRTSCFLAVMILATCSLGDYDPDQDWEIPEAFPGVWYRIAIDPDGNYLHGDGDGWGWYYYPESDTYRMWFYNGPFDPDRRGALEYHVYTKAVDRTRSTYIRARFAWATPEWSQLGTGRPPLPEDMPTLSDEAKYMQTASIYEVDAYVPGTAEAIRPYWIDSYNPEWVAIDIKARNAYTYRGAFHECVPKVSPDPDPTPPPPPVLGACCNRQTGHCTLTTKENCPPPLEWLGAGSTCAQCTPTATSTDFGNAPDPPYQTLLANNGARHTIVPGVFLGNAVGVDDGVVFTSALRPGHVAGIDVIASKQGYLNAWIDFAGNGQFSDRTDMIFADRLLAPGVNRLTFHVPLEAVPGWTYARFRFNTRGLLASFGPAEDGEVEDYRVQIVGGETPLAVSGATRLSWSQPPSLVAGSQDQTQVFQPGGVPSALHLHEIAAADWQLQDNQPITGIHWWGSFEGWSEQYLPREMPLAFHIGIWTDVPDPHPWDFASFARPGTLVWESYCVHWTWSVAGQEASEQGQPGRTCFLFSHPLSQDEWFRPEEIGDAPPTVYWVSIAAVYDGTDPRPRHLWTWKTRPVTANTEAVAIQTVTPSSKGTTWPPTLGARWGSGRALRDRQNSRIDLAFQLTTYAPLEFESSRLSGLNLRAPANYGELALLAADWLSAIK